MIRPIMGQNGAQARQKTSFGSWEVLGKINSQAILKHLDDIAEQSRNSYVYCQVEPHFVIRQKPKSSTINLDIYPVGKAPWYKRQNPKLQLEMRPYPGYPSQKIDVKAAIAERIEKLRTDFASLIAERENGGDSIKVLRKILGGKKREELDCGVKPS